MKFPPQKRVWQILAIGAVAIAVLVLLVTQQVRLVAVSREVSERTETLIDEIRAGAESSLEVRTNVMILADEVNEILEALRLPGSSVSFGEDSGAIDESSEEVSVYLVGVDALVGTWENEQRRHLIGEVRRFLDAGLPSSVYTIAESDRLELDILLDAGTGFTARLEESTDRVLILAADGEERGFAGTDKTLLDFIVGKTPEAEAVCEQRDSMERALKNLFDSADVQAYLRRNELTLGVVSVGLGTLEVPSYSVVRKGRVLMAISIDPILRSYTVGERTTEQAASVFTAVRDQLAAMDIRSTEEVRISELLEAMKGVTNDTGFADYLGSRGLRLVDGGREDSDYHYFDLFGDSDRRIGAFGVQKFVGEIYLVDHEDVPISSLKAFEDNGVKKN
jgi:hypothetical protein